MNAAVRWGSVALLLLTAAVVFLASAAPTARLPDLPASLFGVPVYLLGHFVMYAVLGAEVALVLAAFGLVRRSPLGAPVLAFLGVAGYGLLMEVYQAGVPGRVPSATDAIANTAGALAGVFIVTLAVLLAAWLRVNLEHRHEVAEDP